MARECPQGQLAGNQWMAGLEPTVGDMGLIPKEEEKDKEDKDDTPDKLKEEDFPKGVKLIDLELDNKYLYNDPIDTKPIDILDDVDNSNIVNNDIDNVENTRDNVVNIADNVDVFEVCVQMDDPQEKQQDVNNEDTNVNDAINDSQKVMAEEKKAEEASATEQSVEMQPPLVKKEQLETGKEKPENKSEEKKDEEKKTKIDDDDKEFVSIKGPIDMDNLSSFELMDIATTMQSRA
ncbi:actin cytoskeleton-regulatory complex protein PAN1-like [Cryptomeria japonica]|uniref:actin cytoskeleton-regulatory complex protein PAN1-like n=1 Tax=Cryptomeria japonica TaxID=3369 RepID=UPI0027DA7AD0|nr:actin cytoskeleton-regulatory complex protein PAN1-like [Cryptomeria japonica]